MKFKGIIFDLDGTLLDSMSVWENVDRDFLEENNVPYTPDVSDAVKKMTIFQSAEYFKTRFDLNHSCEYIINRIEEMVSEQYCNHIPLKKGVYETIVKLHRWGIKMCVATATYNSLVNAALKRLGISDMFEFVLTCSDVGSGKDSPEIFLTAAEKLGCKVSETLVAEDSLHCIETAVKAGFFTIGVYDPINRSDWEEICRISALTADSIEKITEIIPGNED
ncbi:MAG: HAD family hydrolase [Porcipelethomonas sp.]